MPVRFRTVSRELMFRVDEGMLISVNGQSDLLFQLRVPRMVLLMSDHVSVRNLGLVSLCG